MKNSGIFACKECGQPYVEESESLANHKKWHEILVNGFITRKSKSDNIIWEDNDYWITEVNPSSQLNQRIKAEKASCALHKTIRNENFSYDFYRAKDNISDLHLFLVHHRQRVIGLVATREKQCLEARWDGNDLLLTERILENPIVVVEMIWLVVSQRKKGLAKKSIIAIAHYFSSEHQAIGWSLPFSRSGRDLAKSISPNTIYVYSSGT